MTAALRSGANVTQQVRDIRARSAWPSRSPEPGLGSSSKLCSGPHPVLDCGPFTSVGQKRGAEQKLDLGSTSTPYSRPGQLRCHATVGIHAESEPRFYSTARGIHDPSEEHTVSAHSNGGGTRRVIGAHVRIADTYAVLGTNRHVAERDFPLTRPRLMSTR